MPPTDRALSPEEVAVVRKAHEPFDLDGTTYCYGCGANDELGYATSGSWPCETIRLLDALQAAERENERLRGEHRAALQSYDWLTQVLAESVERREIVEVALTASEARRERVEQFTEALLNHHDRLVDHGCDWRLDYECLADPAASTALEDDDAAD